ncbi:hypothetical protein QBC47DRAFT_402747 [Echria macrotheca]|uniref:EKC/KEOPS complex subunit GON7 n=1 Tax=Echria macrotheca TaxID=438768 RepID=A0AAJ0B9S6_9PEZI|nr:hypothetical protein QBC47DRAFT_402747 [Echria macrotheca]
MSEPNGDPKTSAPTLSATYTSSGGNEPFTVNIPIAAPSAGASSVEQRTAYLQRLRDAALRVQDQVNRELTERMEQDNAKAQQSASGINDSKEEENYGEEVQEDD